MSIISLDPQTIAAEHFQAIEALYPNLQEPHKGAMKYAISVSRNPNLDKTFYQEAGKVVHVIARLNRNNISNLTDVSNPNITIRGSKAPLSWDADRPSDLQTTDNPSERTFTFRVPPEHANETFEVKLCMVNPGRRFWQAGDNWPIPLQDYGHIAIVHMSDVSFN